MINQVKAYGLIFAALTTACLFPTSANAEGTTCWFQQKASGKLSPERCDVSIRVNANGHKVTDVIDSAGGKASVVFWVESKGDNEGIVEFFYKDLRRKGTWWRDSEGDLRVDIGNGYQFALKIPNSSSSAASYRPTPRPSLRGTLSETPFRF